MFCFLLQAVTLVSAQELHVSSGVFSREQGDSINTVVVNFMAEKDSIRRKIIKEGYPDFMAISLNGDTIRRTDLIGKVTLINFWFEGCAPCIAKFNALSELYSKFKDDPNFLFLSFTPDSADSALITVQKYGLLYPIYSITRDECYHLNLHSGFPMTIILDRNGMVAYYKGGGSTDNEQIIKRVKEYEEKIIELLAKE